MNAEVKLVRLGGVLQVGQGKSRPLDWAALMLRDDGKLEVLLSAESRSFCLMLAPASARALAEKILSTLAPAAAASCWDEMVPPDQAGELVDLAQLEAAVGRARQ